VKTIFKAAVLLVGVLMASASTADKSGRPENIPLAQFQFGPYNRWTFSHMREVLPTVNIGRDPGRFLPLAKSDELISDFSVVFQGREQSIDEIAAHQFIDGLLVLRGGEILFEKYLAQLPPEFFDQGFKII